MTLTIVGLGPSEIDDLTRRAWRALKQAKTVILRTTRHNCVPCLPQGAEFVACDDLYDTNIEFEQVYAAIIERVMRAARAGDVVYAVPGDPLVGEATVTGLLKRAKAEGIAVKIVSGVSFVEPTLALVGVDALGGLQVFDALDVALLHHPPLNPDLPALLGQVYSRAVASDVKLTLMNQYPDDFEVALIHGAGSESPRVEWLKLYEIDRSAHINHLTTLYVPALGGMSSFERFQEIIAHLRAPEGCPWDRKQTHESLRQFLIEEAYEVLDAIDAGDTQALSEELGDVLLQVVLHTQIAIDDGEFNMTDVLRHVNAKMIARHPHVWGDVNVDGADAVVVNWEAIKQREHAQKGTTRDSLLDGVPKGTPALLQAYRYQEKAAKPGFDWHDVSDVVAKVREELDEVLAAQTDDARFEEMGDLLFALVNWARWLKIEPESALRQTNAKFYRRFRYIEAALAEQGRPMEACTLDELDTLWNAAKGKGL